jgi:hypothetical protein
MTVKGFQAQTREIFETIEFQVFSQRDGYQQGFKGHVCNRRAPRVGTLSGLRNTVEPSLG